jgi:hypothetical protein
MSTFAEREGKPRWSDKTPDQNAVGAWTMFPEARVVHIIRDPRDVVASRLETPMIDSEDVRAVARWWRRFNLENIEAGAAAGPRRYLRIRYEDLVRDPEATLHIVCAFLGEDFAPSMIAGRRGSAAVSDVAWWQSRATEPIDSSRVGRHQDTLGRRDRAIVAATVHRDLPALGYPGASRRLVALGHALNALSARPERRLPAMSPQARYDLVQAYLADAVAAATRPPPDP